jgi:hypothetical protein
MNNARRVASQATAATTGKIQKGRRMMGGRSFSTR